MDVSEFIENLKLGKKIHYADCWRCWRFQEFEKCRYRKWFGNQLFCVKEAEKVDTRLIQ